MSKLTNKAPESEVENRRLLLDLLHADSEDVVTEILEESGYLSDKSSWAPFGATEGNWSIAGNQASYSAAALADKMMNSMDAVLVAECYKNGIDPTSSQAPDSMEEAVEKFFHISGGKLTTASSEERKKMSNRIFLVATGAKPGDPGDRNPCYTLVDSGEGQPPERMSKTLLSLPTQGRTSKSSVRFVQGIFNMGGTGVLPFCGRQNYELILSKKCPWAENNDRDSTKWSFTIVRRHRPEGDERMSMYQYLAPSGSILRFAAESLPILPGDYPAAYENNMEYGTCIKMYEYAIQPKALRGPALLDLNYELSRHFYSMPIPVRICERRPDYVAHSKDATLAGMSVRLEDDRSNVLESGFPTGSKVPILGLAEVPVSICVFKRSIGHGEDRKRWMADRGMIFTVNGQTHAIYKRDFFTRQKVNLGYLDKDLFVVVDFTSVATDKKEDLLMPSRDRLRESKDRENIESALEDFLGEHPGLRELNEKRRQEELESVFGKDRPLERILEKLLKDSPSLAGLFGLGERLTKKTTFDWIDRKGNYQGKRFPTFFRLAVSDSHSKTCPTNAARKFRFETDATNDYFIRDTKKGVLSITPAETKKGDTLWNGIFELTARPPMSSTVGMKCKITVQVTDPSRATSFAPTELELVVEEPVYRNGTNVRGHKSTQDSTDTAKHKVGKEGGDEEKKSLALPKITPVTKEDEIWKDHFAQDNDAIDSVPNGDTIDIFVNMSNQHLLNEISNSKPGEKFIFENQFKYGLALVALAIFHDSKAKSQGQSGNGDQQNKEKPEKVFEEIHSATRAIGMVILPMVNNLAGITKTEVARIE